MEEKLKLSMRRTGGKAAHDGFGAENGGNFSADLNVLSHSATHHNNRRPQAPIKDAKASKLG
jgi:hypothetical protein